MANQQIENIEDINEAINPITPQINGTEGLEILGHNRNQPVNLLRFSKSFFKIYLHLVNLYTSVKNLTTGKENSFDKKSGFNLEKTDLIENDTTKLITPAGVFKLKTTLEEKTTKLEIEKVIEIINRERGTLNGNT